MTELEQIIRKEIASNGAIPFARFMELALYHPVYGYYERGLGQTGRAGDFFTSLSVGGLFGEILAFDLAERLEKLEGPLTLVEGGAHDGQLALDILSSLRRHRPGLAGRLGYVIIEPSLRRAQRQRERLAGLDPMVRWVTGWAEMPGFRGACISNELLDAMPVQVFRWDRPGRVWREWGVGNRDEAFCWQPLPGAPPREAEHWFGRLPGALFEVLPDGFTLELSPAASLWWERAARCLQEGWLITADYGFLDEDFLAPERAAGTLRTYAKHRPGSQPIEAAGEQDITAHVNFSALIAAGERAGLGTSRLVSQGSYLKGVLEQIAASPDRFPAWTPERRRQLMSLMHPEHLGRAFKVLVQTRGG